MLEDCSLEEVKDTLCSREISGYMLKTVPWRRFTIYAQGLALEGGYLYMLEGSSLEEVHHGTYRKEDSVKFQKI